jgi:hypothetical protein
MPQWGEIERFRKWLKIGTLKARRKETEGGG